MASKSKKRPTPEELLEEVKGRPKPKTYEFEDYLPVVDELQKKDHSYAQIAGFLGEKLGISVSRGQVYRAYQLWLEVQEQEERERAEAFEHEKWAGANLVEGPDESDPGEKALFEAGRDLYSYLRQKYPDSSKVPGGPLAVVKRVLAMLDSENRDEYEAEEADRLKEARRKKSEPDSA